MANTIPPESLDEFLAEFAEGLSLRTPDSVMQFRHRVRKRLDRMPIETLRDLSGKPYADRAYASAFIANRWLREKGYLA